MCKHKKISQKPRAGLGDKKVFKLNTGGILAMFCRNYKNYYRQKITTAEALEGAIAVAFLVWGVLGCFSGISQLKQVIRSTFQQFAKSHYKMTCELLTGVILIVLDSRNRHIAFFR